MAKTKNGIVYPDNYDKVADVPADLKELAESVDEVIENNKTEMKNSNETRDKKISKNAEDIEAIQESIKTATETINKKDNAQDDSIMAIQENIETINSKNEEQDSAISDNATSIKNLQAKNVEINAENERLREDIKSIAVVNEVSGENIHVEDSSDARCELEIGGNHVQETREGYNLLNNTLQSQTINGLKVTVNKDKSVTVVGTATANTNIVFDVHNKTIEAGTYTLKDCRTFIENTENKGWWNDGETRTFTNTATLTDKGFFMFYSSGTVVNETLYPMLIKGSELKPYEQYGASPSIDYPSKAKSVGDNINMLFTNPDDWEQGTIIDGANASSMTRIRTKNFIDIIDNEDYYVSIQNTQYCFLNIVLYKEDKTYIGQYYSLNNAINGANHLKINLPTDAKKIRVIIRNLDNVSDISPSDIEMIKPKLEKSSVVTPYSSYNCGSTKVDIKNENIFNTENVKSTSEVSVVDNKIGVLELQGVNGFWKGITTTQKFETGKRVYVKCKYVAGTGSAANIGIKDTNGDDILENYKVSNNLISCSFISKGITKIFFRCNGTSNNGNIKYSDIMFSYEDIDYIPHQEQSYLVDVQQPMFKGDTFIRQDGKWYEKHCVKTEIMLTFPTTNIEVCGTFANFQTNRNIAFAVVKNDLKITNVRNDILCDKLKAKDNSMWGGKEDGIQTYINSNKFMISIPFEDIEKNFGEELTINNYSQAFRKYINDNPLKIYYKLAEPELIECTEAQSKVLDEIYNKAHTYKNITNISAESSEVNPIVSLKYLKDAETEHNKLQAQIDEIKELLSSTATSAMLLNNMQTDLESEV